jgi:hypothetical protein
VTAKNKSHVPGVWWVYYFEISTSPKQEVVCRGNDHPLCLSIAALQWLILWYHGYLIAPVVRALIVGSRLEQKASSNFLG